MSERLGLAGGEGQVPCALGSHSLHLELQGWVSEGPSCCSDGQDFTEAATLHSPFCGTLGCHSESKILKSEPALLDSKGNHALIRTHPEKAWCQVLLPLQRLPPTAPGFV